MFEQQPDLLQIRNRPHQCRGARSAHPIRIDAVFEQKLHDLLGREHGRGHQGWCAIGIHDVWAHSGLQKMLDLSGSSALDRSKERVVRGIGLSRNTGDEKHKEQQSEECHGSSLA